MSRFFRSLAAIFLPPFNGLALVVILYVAWAHFVFPHNDIIRGNLPDPDDYMYLDEVLDWIKGQGWYDNVQHRLNPPQGVPIHFSRLAMLPMAAGILFFESLGLKPHGAAMVMALIYPFFLLGFCLYVLRRVSAFVVPARWAGASAYIALFAVGLLFEFMPGHIDHHGLIVVLVMASVGCLLRMMETPDDWKECAEAATAAGLILALSMVIALETLPWVLLFSAWIGFWSIQRGGIAARSGGIFGAVFLMGITTGLALTRPAATFLEHDILTFSIVYVFLAAGIALPFIGTATTSNASLPIRWAVGLTLAVLCSEVFLQYFPDLVAGPYGGIDPQLIPILLDEVEEAKPILHGSNGASHMLNLMSMGFIALPASLFFTWRARNYQKWQWGLLTLVLGSAFFMTIFYQYRFLGVEAAAAVIPLVALLYQGWTWVGANLAGRKKVLAEIGLLLLIGPLPSVIIPALFDSRSFNIGMFLFPVDSGRTPCDMARLEHVLRDPERLGDKTHLIASTIELGPEFLFRTEHQVLAAPFHMNVQGNVDAARFLSSSYPQESENIARRRGIDLVVICRSMPNIYIAPPGQEPSLVQRLFKGDIPKWLHQVPANDIDNFTLYRVLPPTLESKPKK